jgi:hypothetical protein
MNSITKTGEKLLKGMMILSLLIFALILGGLAYKAGLKQTELDPQYIKVNVCKTHSIIEEREKCNKQGGMFSAYERENFITNEIEFRVICELPTIIQTYE